jgi:hypothetical protein
MPSWIDGALYPDAETPTSISTLPEQVDFLRGCALPGISECCPKGRP